MPPGRVCLVGIRPHNCQSSAGIRRHSRHATAALEMTERFSALGDCARICGSAPTNESQRRYSRGDRNPPRRCGSFRRFNAVYEPCAQRAALIALIQCRTAGPATTGRRDDINYRRFFNVNELAGLRVELPAVFEHTHRRVLDLVGEGRIDALRIDHIDGLLDPAAYISRLRDACSDAKPNAAREIYLVVEKILAGDEELPEDWQVDGTTGYEFCDASVKLLVDQRGEAALTQGYESFIGTRPDFEQVLRAGKIRVMNNEMAAELHVLARAAARIARMSALTADFTSGLLLRAIRATIACLPVYRTYLNATAVPGAQDLQDGDGHESARQFDRERPQFFTFWNDCSVALAGLARLYPAQGVVLCDAHAAIQWPRHGQGAGGHGLLPLQPLHRPE